SYLTAHRPNLIQFHKSDQGSSAKVPLVGSERYLRVFRLPRKAYPRHERYVRRYLCYRDVQPSYHPLSTYASSPHRLSPSEQYLKATHHRQKSQISHAWIHPALRST